MKLFFLNLEWRFMEWLIKPRYNEVDYIIKQLDSIWRQS